MDWKFCCKSTPATNCMAVYSRHKQFYSQIMQHILQFITVMYL